MLFLELVDVSYYSVVVGCCCSCWFDGTVIKFECIDLMWAPDANTDRAEEEERKNRIDLCSIVDIMPLY